MIAHDVLSTATMTNAGFDAFTALPENADKRFELINGEIIEMPSARPRHNVIAMRIIAKFILYLELNSVGFVLGDNNDFDLALGLVIQPDVLYFSYGRMPTLPDRFTIAPDIAIEVISPLNCFRDIEEKIDAYLEYGSLFVWIINPEDKKVRVSTRAADGSRSTRTLTADDTLTGGDVLPGFAVKVADIFPTMPVEK